MDTSYHHRVEAIEKPLASYITSKFQGYARVRLDCLTFQDDIEQKIDDGKDLQRVTKIMLFAGCWRQIPESLYVNVEIDASDWGERGKQLKFRNQGGGTA
jgi:hypothetical protein